MAEPQPTATQPTPEERLMAIATNNGMTLKELRELVFQYQRAENKSCKEENDMHENQQKTMVNLMNGTKIENERMRLTIEYAEMKPIYDLVRKGKYPKKKKFLWLF